MSPKEKLQGENNFWPKRTEDPSDIWKMTDDSWTDKF